MKLPPTDPHLSRKEIDVSKKWEGESDSVIDNGGNIPRKSGIGRYLRKIFVFSLVFFLACAGFLAYMILSGTLVISSDKVDITFLGPVSVAGGGELDFDILTTNNNKSPIENVTMYIDYPDGTRTVEDTTQPLLHTSENLGEIVPGGNARRTSRSIVFGETDTKKDVVVTVEYGLKNSTATYKKSKTYEITINSTPVIISVGHPDNVVSNDVVEFKVSIKSNTSVPLTNLILKADYPFGFIFSDSDPKPTFDTTEWQLPTLNPGETQDFTLRGQMQGEDGDQRFFNFSVGASNVDNNKAIATNYLTDSESVFIKKPPLNAVLSLNNADIPSATTDFSVDRGKSVNGRIVVTNNLSVPIVGVEASVNFSGELFDRTNVAANNGFYDSSNNRVIWNSVTTPSLSSINPGQSVKLDFSFSTLPPSTSSSKNATMALAVSVDGTNVSSSQSSQAVSTAFSKTIKTTTSLGFVQRVVYSSGPFRNRGPVPPKVDTKTTYTVIWTATDFSNDVTGAVARATLPVNSVWLNAVSPSNESVTWNKTTNEVVWNMGNLSGGSGYAKPAREVAFQVELTPDLSQLGQLPLIIGGSTLTATDSFTTTPLSAKSPQINTFLSTDTAYNNKKFGVVTQ